MHSSLACGDPGGAKCAGTWTASTGEVMALSESFFEPLLFGDQKVSLASLFLYLHPFRHLEGSLAWGPFLSYWLGSYTVDQHVRHLKGHPGWGPTQ